MSFKTRRLIALILIIVLIAGLYFSGLGKKAYDWCRGYIEVTKEEIKYYDELLGKHTPSSQDQNTSIQEEDGD